MFRCILCRRIGVKIILGDLPLRVKNPHKAELLQNFGSGRHVKQSTVKKLIMRCTLKYKRQEYSNMKYSLLRLLCLFSRDLKVRLCRDKTMDLNKKG